MEGVTEKFPKAWQAVQSVQAGEFAQAKDILLLLNQTDFARKPRMERISEDRMEVVAVPPIGNRDLLLARCHVELGEHHPAQALLWEQIEQECTTQELFVLFAREFEGEHFALAEKKLKLIETNFPDNDAAKLARQYLTVAHAVADGDVATAVEFIRSGAWSRESEHGPLAEFKEWTCARLVKCPQASLPPLIRALQTNEQPMWIVYCLGQIGSQHALAPLETAKQRIKNYYARLEIDAAIARIKKSQKENVEPIFDGNGVKCERSRCSSSQLKKPS